MNLKKMIQAVGDCNRSRQERMFRLLVMLGLIGLAAGIISGFVAGENLDNLFGMIFAFALLIFATFFTIHYRKIQLGAVVIASLIIFFILPFNFLTSGGIYGGAPIWFLFGVVFVCLVIEKKVKYVLIVSSFFLNAICYYIAYYYPEVVVFHTIQAAYIDSFATLAIVTTMICGMILFQNAIYRSENETTQKQKKQFGK